MASELSASKIKSLLRQSTRLLQREDLRPDVRVETERRRAALLEDLEAKEAQQVQHKFHARYKKVQFFDRQKVLRRIKQAKRSADEAERKKDKKSAAEKLEKLRVDLNYIDHFPLRKYVAVFPEGEYVDHTVDAFPKDKHDAVQLDRTSHIDGDDQRQQVRKWIRINMQKGEFPNEPESAKRKKPSHDTALPPKKSKKARTESRSDGESADEQGADDFFV